MDNPYIIESAKCAAPNCMHTAAGEINHWFIIIPIPSSPPSLGIPCPFTLALPCMSTGILLVPYDSYMLRMFSRALPVCGQACVQKVIEKYLSSGVL